MCDRHLLAWKLYGFSSLQFSDRRYVGVRLSLLLCLVCVGVPSGGLRWTVSQSLPTMSCSSWQRGRRGYLYARATNDGMEIKRIIYRNKDV